MGSRYGRFDEDFKQGAVRLVLRTVRRWRRLPGMGSQARLAGEQALVPTLQQHPAGQAGASDGFPCRVQWSNWWGQGSA